MNTNKKKKKEENARKINHNGISLNTGEISGKDNKPYLCVFGIVLLLLGVYYFGKKLEMLEMVRLLVLSMLAYFMFLAYLTARSRKLDKEGKIRTISSVMIIGFGAAVIMNYVSGTILNKGYPINTFLYLPEDAFMDFVHACNILVSKAHNQAGEMHFVGPANLLYSFFSLINPGSVKNNYIIYASFFIVFFIWYNYSNMKESNYCSNAFSGDLFILTFLSYPLLFCLDRGNAEMYIFVVLALSFYYYTRKKTIVSAFYMALSIAIKPYFGIFLLIFLVDKKIKEFILSVLFLLTINNLLAIIQKFLYPHTNFGILQNQPVLLMIFTTMIFVILSIDKMDLYKKTGENFSILLKKINSTKNGRNVYKVIKYAVLVVLTLLVLANLGNVYKKVYDNFLSPGIAYNVLYAIGDGGAPHASSIYASIKEILILHNPQYQVIKFFNVYPFIILPVFIGILIYLFTIEKVMWKRIALLTLSMCGFPFVTPDYRLIHMFIPMWMFINDSVKNKFDPLYALLFGLILIPSNYFILRGAAVESSITHAIIIVIFMSLIIYEGVTDKKQVSST